MKRFMALLIAAIMLAATSASIWADSDSADTLSAEDETTAADTEPAQDEPAAPAEDDAQDDNVYTDEPAAPAEDDVPVLGENDYAEPPQDGSDEFPDEELNTMAADGGLSFSEGVVGGSVYYKIYNGNEYNAPAKEKCIEITGCDAGVTSAVIPASIDGIPVVSIGGSAFANKSINSVTLNEGLLNIGSAAFRGSHITSVTVPSTVATLGNYSFAECPALREATVLGTLNGGYYTFSGCNQLTKVVMTANTLIPAYCFENCSALFDVTFSNKLVTIDNSAFSKCASLMNVSLPQTVEKIGSNAFYNCTRLSDVTLSKSLLSIENSAFYNTPALKSITFPDGLQSIGEAAFYCSGLEGGIVLPESLTQMGSRVFEGCYYIESIYLPGSLAAIPANTCSNCVSLSSVTIGEGTIRICGNAFSKIPGLLDGSYTGTYIIKSSSLNITLPSTIQIIEDSAFALRDGGDFAVTVASVKTAACEERWKSVVVNNTANFYDGPCTRGNDDFLNAEFTFAKHTYKYKFDETNHWQECDGCKTRVGDNEKHEFDENSTCKTCGFSKNLTPDDPHEHIFIDVITSEHHGKECKLCGLCKDFARHTLGADGICTGCHQKPMGSGFDVNGDGRITLDDAILVLKKAMNIG